MPAKPKQPGLGLEDTRKGAAPRRRAAPTSANECYTQAQLDALKRLHRLQCEFIGRAIKAGVRDQQRREESES